MTARPLYIFDLDGTLALIGHRRHYVQCPREEQNWAAFSAACVDDEPNLPVISAMLGLIESGAEVWIFSGRSDVVRAETIQWLSDHAKWHRPLDTPALTMRREGDYTPDDELKLGWLNSMLPEDRERLVAVFEDRDRMVTMWRANGVACFQVAPGDF